MGLGCPAGQDGILAAYNPLVPDPVSGRCQPFLLCAQSVEWVACHLGQQFFLRSSIQNGFPIADNSRGEHAGVNSSEQQSYQPLEAKAVRLARPLLW